MGFRICDEHNGSIVTYATNTKTYEKNECPICTEIKELKEELSEAHIAYDRLIEQLKRYE